MGKFTFKVPVEGYALATVEAETEELAQELIEGEDCMDLDSVSVEDSEIAYDFSQAELM